MIKKADFLSLVISDKAVETLKNIDSSELEKSFGRDFANMKNYNQNNPHHCYDLLEHALKTVTGIRRENEILEDFIFLRTAAFFHDIGKPYVAKEKNNRTVFYHHAEKSAEITELLLDEIGFSPKEIERICFFIEFHDVFISCKLPEEIKNENPYITSITKDNIKKLITEISNTYGKEHNYTPSLEDFSLLVRLCEADASAQSEKVYYLNNLVDTKENKIKRVLSIQELIYEIALVLK